MLIHFISYGSLILWSCKHPLSTVSKSKAWTVNSVKMEWHSILLCVDSLMTPSLFYYPKLSVLFWFVSLQSELETHAPAIINNANLYFPTYYMCNAVAFMHVKNKLKKKKHVFKCNYEQSNICIQVILRKWRLPYHNVTFWKKSFIILYKW